MHILFLTDNFPPEVNAPATRTYEHAREWVKAGHRVTVITCAPNFPDGKVYEGYKNAWCQRSQMEGIDVVRVKTFIAPNRGFNRRVLDFLSYAMMAFWVGLFQKKPDVIVATSPQFFSAASGWLLSVFKRKPFVFELRDLWPSSVVEVGAMGKNFLIRWVEAFELFLYRRAARVVAVTHSFKENLVSRGIDPRKIDVVINGVDLEKYRPAEKKNAEVLEKFELQNKFVVAYVGTLGMAHGLGNVISAAEALRENDEVRFVLAGAGADKPRLESLVKSKGLRNVIFVPRQPKERMPDLWSICDLSLIHLINTPLFETVIPSKIFESMGMGLPMIIALPQGEATRLVEDADAGVAVPPEKSQALADAVLELLQNPERCRQMAENSRKAAEHYDRKVLAGQMLESLELAADLPDVITRNKVTK